MPSPFPGMDPYLESPDRWGSFHQWLTTCIAAHLNGKLPGGFVAELDQYVWLTTDLSDERELLGRPDVFVSPRGEAAALPPAGGVAAAPTVESRLAKSKRNRKSFVKITSARGAEVLTVLELLSPSNKRAGPGHAAYLAKRNEYLGTGVNFVEIDLLRAGARPPLGRPQPPATDYYITLFARDKPLLASVWAFGVREAIPVVPVPFRSGVPPVTLDVRRVWTGHMTTGVTGTSCGMASRQTRRSGRAMASGQQVWNRCRDLQNAPLNEAARAGFVPRGPSAFALRPYFLAPGSSIDAVIDF